MLGYIYLSGIAVKQDIQKSIYYFEISAKCENADSLFALGELYSNGLYIDANIQKAIDYFLRCINIQKKLFVSKNVNDISNSYFGYQYNNYYYASNNSLGLIYITILNDKDLAMKYIKESGLNEFPYGQNNLGLMYQFYFDNIQNAEYYYSRASKNNFALAYFNLGQLKEKAGEINESIDLFISASDHEDYPLVFHNIEYIDERLDISKLFITSLANLKLVNFYYSQEERSFEKSKHYFILLIERLIQFECNEYPFQFQFNNNDNIDDEYIASYLIKFILGFPLFNLINNDDKQVESFAVSGKDLIINNNALDEKGNCLSYAKTNDYYERRIAECDENNESLDSSSSFFDFFINCEKRRQIFKNCIRNIIEKMEKIIYTPPYNILFGRIPTKKLKLNRENAQIQNKFRKNINKSFYEGFGIQF